MIKIVKPNLMLKIMGKENATGLQFSFDTALQRTEEWTLVAIKLHALLKLSTVFSMGRLQKAMVRDKHSCIIAFSKQKDHERS